MIVSIILWKQEKTIWKQYKPVTSYCMCLWRVCVRSWCVGKVRGLNNAVPTSMQKQAGIRPPRHTTDTQSSMKTQGYTKQWPVYLCQGRAHSGTQHGRWQVEKKVQVTIEREPAQQTFPGLGSQSALGVPMAAPSMESASLTHSVVELAELRGWDSSSRWQHNGPSNPTTRRTYRLQRWCWYFNESTLNQTSLESQVSSTLWY